ncbi:MAG: hypothetical protein AAGB31_07635, partial [Bdellovibrio sp.]
RVQASSQLSLLDAEFHTATSTIDEESSRTQLPQEIQGLMQELEHLPLMQMSPLEAMNQIAKWKEMVTRTSQEV